MTNLGSTTGASPGHAADHVDRTDSQSTSAAAETLLQDHAEREEDIVVSDDDDASYETISDDDDDRGSDQEEKVEVFENIPRLMEDWRRQSIHSQWTTLPHIRDFAYVTLLEAVRDSEERTASGETDEILFYPTQLQDDADDANDDDDNDDDDEDDEEEEEDETSEEEDVVHQEQDDHYNSHEIGRRRSRHGGVDEDSEGGGWQGTPPWLRDRHPDSATLSSGEHRGLHDDDDDHAANDDDIRGRAVALYTFEPEHENEFALEEGQLIYVSSRHGLGWLVAVDPVTGDCGLVPEEYVEFVPDEDDVDDGIGGPTFEGEPNDFQDVVGPCDATSKSEIAAMDEQMKRISDIPAVSSADLLPDKG